MNEALKLFKVLSDETRLRTLMLLTKEELCVCQVMGVLGVSQPLVSRNLAMLASYGLLSERRDGKLVFYSLKKPMPRLADRAIRVLREEMKGDPQFEQDLQSLEDCHEFQRTTGRCDMKTFLEFMERRKGGRTKAQKG
jgi:ArsR family transcriptional regulator